MLPWSWQVTLSLTGEVKALGLPKQTVFLRQLKKNNLQKAAWIFMVSASLSLSHLYLVTPLLSDLSAAHLYPRALQSLPDPLLGCSNLFLMVELVSLKVSSTLRTGS